MSHAKNIQDLLQENFYTASECPAGYGHMEEVSGYTEAETVYLPKDSFSNSLVRSTLAGPSTNRRQRSFCSGSDSLSIPILRAM